MTALYQRGTLQGYAVFPVLCRACKAMRRWYQQLCPRHRYFLHGPYASRRWVQYIVEARN